MSKFDKLYKLNIGHNVTEAFDFHILCVALTMRILHRRHKTAEIYTEHNPLNPNMTYPDIWLTLKNRHIVYEFQTAYTQKWITDIVNQYRDLDVDLVTIPLKHVKDKWETRCLNNLVANKTCDPLKELKTVLQEYI